MIVSESGHLHFSKLKSEKVENWGTKKMLKLRDEKMKNATRTKIILFFYHKLESRPENVLLCGKTPHD